MSGEAGLLTTLFSRKPGKFRALAENRKRFGRGLNFFNLLAVEAALNKGRFNLIGNVMFKEDRGEIMKSVEPIPNARFYWSMRPQDAC